MTPLLHIDDMHVTLPTARGKVHALRGISLAVSAGETLALVGESGSGKSVTAQAILGLLPGNAAIQSRAMTLQDQPLYLPNTAYRRSTAVAMVFQNPMGTFNPTLTLGYQIAEPLRVHHGMTRHDAEQEVLRLLARMHIEKPSQRAQQYPHEFSGGMLQRAAIAMALAMRPRLLIADEITTALDVSTQQAVLALLDELRAEQQLAMLFITHDLALVARHADRAAVMYAGQIVESGDVTALLTTPQHPYTQALLASLPGQQPQGHRLKTIEGNPPDLHTPPTGCAFCARCDQAMNICARETPSVTRVTEEHSANCWQLQTAGAVP